MIGEDTVMVVVPRAALDAALSSELLTSRTPVGEREPPPEPRTPTTTYELPPRPTYEPHARPTFEPLDALDNIPPPAYREHAEAVPPPPAHPSSLVSHASSPPSSPTRAARPTVARRRSEELRLRVRQLEAELEQRNAVAFEVQRHLQAALRRLYS